MGPRGRAAQRRDRKRLRAADHRQPPPEQERQAAGSAAYWDSFWDADQVFYGHVLGFKGLERRAVVLVVNEESAFERSRERPYVGLSRARDQLVVCGDPDFIREVGGPDLARRLNLPPNGRPGPSNCRKVLTTSRFVGHRRRQPWLRGVSPSVHRER